MTRIRVKKLSNPRRVAHRKANAKKKTKRKLTPRQIKAGFGGKRRQSALKRKAPKKNPVYRQAKRQAKAKRRAKRTSHNPAPLILTVGAVNPRRSKPMAQKKAKKRKSVKKNARRVSRRAPQRRRRRVVAHNPRPRRRARKQNRRRNTRVIVMQPRRANRRKSRRNPGFFGTSMTSTEGLKLIAGGLAGVAAAKFLPTLLPASIGGGIASSNVGRTVLTGVAAVAAGFIAGKWDKRVGDAVLFGGLMQTASVALNAFLPSLYQSLGIGLGEFAPGRFGLPQNPLRELPAAPAYLPAASGSRVQTTRLAGAYNPAY
jgi:hypothetical protein